MTNRKLDSIYLPEIKIWPSPAQLSFWNFTGVICVFQAAAYKSELIRGSVLTCGLELRQISSQSSFLLDLLKIPLYSNPVLPLPSSVEPRALIPSLLSLLG